MSNTRATDASSTKSTGRTDPTITSMMGTAWNLWPWCSGSSVSSCTASSVSSAFTSLSVAPEAIRAIGQVLWEPRDARVTEK